MIQQPRNNDCANDDLNMFKMKQKESWGVFAPLEIFTTIPAASLVKFARLKTTSSLLDVGCGTGVVAITAAKAGVNATGLDLSPELIKRAKLNAEIAKLQVTFVEGDVENLPYPDQSFDTVLSQFGHMFAPRPAVAISEMLRVLKPGGRIAFSTWPPDFFVGRLFNLIGKYSEAPAIASPPARWGDTTFVREQLKDLVDDLTFDQGVMHFPALSMGHYMQMLETTLGPVVKLVQKSHDDQTHLQAFRNELITLASEYYANNYLHQVYLMTRAIKK